ncbi:MAG: hypothetical protein H0Z32_07775 [Bacillaceae bacterium]|nr:hypothetical protein [Bacillaceae bacterium]
MKQIMLKLCIIIFSFVIVKSLVFGFIYLTAPKVSPYGDCIGCYNEARSLHFGMYGFLGSVITVLIGTPILSTSIYKWISKKNKKIFTSDLGLMVIASITIGYLLHSLLFEFLYL